MKRFHFLLLYSLVTLTAFAENEDKSILYIFHNNGMLDGVYTEDIIDIRHSYLDLDSVRHSVPVVQEVWTSDTVIRYPLADLDSMTFVRPETRYQPGVIKLDERFKPYIASSNGMNICFTPDMPIELRPKIGDILLYEGYNQLFPDGFAGCVSSSTDNAGSILIQCDSVTLSDVFEQFVFYGEYDIFDDGKEDTPMRAARHRQSRPIVRNNATSVSNWCTSDDKWHSDGDSLKSSIELSWKKSFPLNEEKTEKLTLSTKGKLTTKLKIAINYSIKAYDPHLFIHVGPVFDLDVDASCALGTKKDTMDVSVDCKDLELVKDSVDNTPRIDIIDKEVAIPDCPALTIGIKFGLFVKAEAKANLLLSAHFHHKFGKTIIFRDGDMQYGDVESDKNLSWGLDGELSGSVFAGVCTELSAGLPAHILREKASLYFGPAVEGSLKFDLKEGAENWSFYSLIQGSKARAGLKLEGGLDLEAKLSDELSWSWSQIKLSPDHWFFESEGYLVPKFTKPEYKVLDDHTLFVSSVVSRDMFIKSNIGFRVYDEQGNIVRTKYQSVPLILSNQYCNPITETFDDLDFAHHLYTVVPISNPHYLGELIHIPAQPNITITCPDSNHPHTLNLGLSSGTLWSCCNLGAKKPESKGDYYAFGEEEPKDRFIREEYTWRYGFVDISQGEKYEGTHFSGTNFDVAHNKLGGHWQMPGIDQLMELGRECTPSFIRLRDGVEVKYIDEENSDYAVRLTGPNGQNMIIPFTGQIADAHVQNNSSTFWAGDYYPVAGEPKNAVALETIMSGITAKGIEANAVHLDPHVGCQIRAIRGGVWNAMNFTEEMVDMGRVRIGQKASRTVTVNNNTNSDAICSLVLQSGHFPSSDSIPLQSGNFSIKSEDRDFILGPKSSRDIEIVYEPWYISKKESCQIKLHSDLLADEYISTYVQGVALEREIKAIHASLEEIDFGKIIIGEQREIHFELMNTGNVPLSLNFEQIPEKVFVCKECGTSFTIQPGENKPITVTFTPDQKQKYYSMITGHADGIDGAITVILTGTGVAEFDLVNFVDLGLPSGLLWCDCNLGARAPEEIGSYFAWGETQAKNYYEWTTYKHSNQAEDRWTKYCSEKEWGTVDNLEVLELEDDAAYVHMPGTTVPSPSQFDELCQNTTQEWKTINGVSCVRFTGSNGNYIDLPAGGYKCSSYVYETNICHYWTNTKCWGPYAHLLTYDDLGWSTCDGYTAFCGMPIRPVQKPGVNTKNIDFPNIGQHLWMAKDIIVYNQSEKPMSLGALISKEDLYDDDIQVSDLRIYAAMPEGVWKEITESSSIQVAAESEITIWVCIRLREVLELNSTIHLISDNPKCNVNIPVHAVCPALESDFVLSEKGTKPMDSPILTFEPNESKTLNLTNEIPGTGIIICSMPGQEFYISGFTDKEINTTLNGKGCSTNLNLDYRPKDSNPHITVLKVVSVFDRFTYSYGKGNSSYILIQGK